MGYNFAGGGGDSDQVFLLPPDPREWLPGRHLAWAVRAAAQELDMAPFVAGYRDDGQGHQAYHPRLMVALVMYCYCKGIRSSRAVEMATYDDVGARVICGNLHPDHSTVARFVGRHEAAVKGLLVQSLVACAKQGLVSVDVVAGDGTKVKASASMAANATAGELEIEIGELEALLAAEVDSWLAQARAADAAEDALFGGGDDGGDGPGAGGGPGTLARLTGKIARRQKAKTRLDGEQAARQAQAEADQQGKLAKAAVRVAARERDLADMTARQQAKVAGYERRAAAAAARGGNGADGRPPVPPDAHAHIRRSETALAKARRHLAATRAAAAAAATPKKPPKANTTDPASRVMLAKNGGFGQLHNVQILGGKHQVIYAIGTHGNPADTAALHPLLGAARANLDAAGISQPIGKALFDAGYASDDNFTTPCQPELYVALTKEARQTGRLRDGKQPGTMKESWRQMAARLDTPDGKALYRRRSAIIEPVFAQLFARLGRHLNYRDTKTGLELHLWAASHNLLKAIRAPQRNTSPAAPAPAT